MSHEPAKDMGFSRRKFIGGSAAALALGLLSSCSAESDARQETEDAGSGKKGLILGASREHNSKGESRYWLGMVDFDTPTPSTRKMSLPFFAHGLVPHPIERQRLALFEKRGRGACEVDLATGAIIRMIETLPHREFYGHGAFSPDGKLCYAAESDLDDNYVGVIAIRDAKTMEIVGDFPTFGSAPHDCHLIDGGRRMVVTNGGDKVGGKVAPSVTILDVAKQALIERIEFDTPSINAGHVAIASDESLAIVSAPREGSADYAKLSGAISLRPKGQELERMTEPAEVCSKMLGETLSVAIHEGKRVVAATNPAGNIVTFWHLDRREYLGSIEFENPRGVILSEDQRDFIISYGQQQSHVVRVSVNNLKIARKAEPVPTVIVGSHLINYRYNA